MTRLRVIALDKDDADTLPIALLSGVQSLATVLEIPAGPSKEILRDAGITLNGLPGEEVLTVEDRFSTVRSSFPSCFDFGGGRGNCVVDFGGANEEERFKCFCISTLFAM